MRNVDFIIIGAGAGGLQAAHQAAERNQTVALIERDKLGGACVHYGCLPTKSLVISSRFLRKLNHADDFGIQVPPQHASLGEFLTRQRMVVSKLYEQTLREIDRPEISLIYGQACIKDPGTVEVTDSAGKVDTIQGRKIIVATGSRPAQSETLKTDGERILNSNDLLRLGKAPGQLVFIGGGYIPTTYSSIFRLLESQVTILTDTPHILSEIDPIAGTLLQKNFEHAGIQVLTNSKVVRLDRQSHSVLIQTENGQTLETEVVCVAIGRVPNIENIGLCNVGLPEEGPIKTNTFLETQCPGIYAIGDVNGISPLAHAAIAQGRFAVLNALGEDRPFQSTLVPTCVFTTPEIATIGYTESSAAASGFDPVTVQYPMSKVGRAMAAGELEGVVKIIADRASRRILGGTIVGGYAAEMIGQIGMAINLEIQVNDFTSLITAHPTFSEAIQEAAWLLQKEFPY